MIKLIRLICHCPLDTTVCAHISGKIPLKGIGVESVDVSELDDEPLELLGTVEESPVLVVDLDVVWVDLLVVVVEEEDVRVLEDDEALEVVFVLEVWLVVLDGL